MSPDDLTSQIQVLSLAATEAVEETDVIERHPEVVDILAQLAEYEGLADLFDIRNGHEPAAYLSALAEALSPYRHAPLDDAPELVEGLAFVASTLGSEQTAKGR